MASIDPARAALDVIACTKQLATGEFVAYIEHRPDGSADDETESFIAGVFADAAAARAAAVRLMQTFQSSVVVPGGEHCSG